MRRSRVLLFLFVVIIQAAAWSPAAAETAGITAEEAALILEDTSGKFESAEAVIVFDRISTEYKENGSSVTEEEVLIHFREESGGAGFRSLHYDYNPRTAVVKFLEVKVFRAGGEIEDPVAAGEIFTAKAPAYSIFWNFDVTICPLPRMEKGDALYYRIERRGLNLAYLGREAGSAGGVSAQGASGAGPGLAAAGGSGAAPGLAVAGASGADSGPATGGGSGVVAGGDAPAEDEEGDFVPPHRGYFMDTLFFEDELPIIEKTYRIRGPRSRPLQFATANGGLSVSSRFSEDEWFYEFTVADRPAYEREPYDDGFGESALKLAVAAHPSWEMKSRWAFEHNEPQFVISPELQAEVDRLVEDSPDDYDKMFRLLHWVAEEIRYLGLDMGEGEGHMVHRTDEIFADRSGVCKDKAAVLVSMLRAAGFETYFVMTLAMEQTMDIPADDKFNHGVVAVRGGEGGWIFLDPTWAPSNRPLFNYLEQEQPVLVASPEGTGLLHVPYSPPEESPLLVTARTTLDADGNAKSGIFIETDGFYDGSIRSQLSYLDEKSRESFFREILDGIAPRLELVEFAFSDPRDFYQPMQLRMVAEFPGAAVKAGEDLYFSPLLTRHIFGGRYMADYLYLEDSGEERAHAAELACTRLVKFVETINYPRGYRLESLPDSVSCESPTMDLEFSAVAAGKNSCTLEQVMRVKKRITPAREYAALAEVSKKASELLETKLVLKRDGKRLRNPKFKPPSEKTAPVDDTFPPYGARVKHHKITLVLENDGTMVERYYTAAEVYTADGRDRYADHLFTIHTGIQDYKIVELYTQTPDGRKIESPPTAINLTLGGIVAGAPDYRHIHTLAASLVGVEFGSTLVSTIERRTRVEETDGPGNMEYLFQPFDNYPVDRAEFAVDMPENMKLNYDLLDLGETSLLVASDGGRRVFTWEFTDLPPLAAESHAGPYYEMQPALVVSASPTPGWKARLTEVAAGFFDCETPPGAVADKAAALTKDADSALDKLQALTNYVSGRIDFVYTHPRRFLYRMRSPERILAAGYGHSLDRMKLLASLAESLGWNFELGMAGPAGRVSDTVPCLRSVSELFGIVTAGGEKLYASLDNPDFSRKDLAGKTAFFLGRGGTGRLVTPGADLDGNSCGIDLKLILDGEGGVSGSVELICKGAFNPFAAARTGTDEWVKGVIPAMISEPAVKKLDVLRLSEGPEGSRFHCSFEGKYELEFLAEGIVLLTAPFCPGGFSDRGYNLCSDPKRRNPLYLGSGGIETGRIEIEYPENWGIDFKPPDTTRESKFTRFERRVEETENEDCKSIVVDRRLEIAQPVIPASEYGNFLESWLAFSLEEGSRIIFNQDAGATSKQE